MALNYNVQGSVNYTIVGSPTIVDGVASGFSGSDYICVYANNITDNFEIVVKAKIQQNVGTWKPFAGINFNDGSGNYLGNLTFEGGGRYYFSYTDVAYIQCGGSCSNNTWYYLKLARLGNVLSISRSEDGINYTTPVTTEIPQQSYIPSSYIFFGQAQGTSGFGNSNGSIDLNQTYIKVNGQAWFGVCPVEVKRLVYRAPNDYTLSGVATVNNGILTNVDGSSYCVTPSLPDFNEIEFLFKISKRGTITAVIPVCAFGSINNTRRIRSSSSAGTGVLSASSNEFLNISNEEFDSWSAINTGLYIKLKVVKNTSDYTYTLSLSSDNENWTTKSVNFESNICYGILSLLRNSTGNRPNATMDLNYSYVKVNGKLWFFHPATNYLVKDGKLVFADSGVYIDDNGTKTYASANIAPVPSGFTYGNTTTTDVGYVDMTTQAFTAVPGATWGKDE